MTVRRILECNECQARVTTRTAIGHAHYQEFAFACPKCRIELRFGMALDQENPEVKYTLLSASIRGTSPARAAAWRDSQVIASGIL